MPERFVGAQMKIHYPCIQVFRIERQCAFVALPRRSGAFQKPHQVAEIIVCLRVIRLQRNCALQVLHGSGMLMHLRKPAAKVIVRFRMVRAQPDSRFKTANGIRMSVQRGKCDTHVVMSGGIVLEDCNRLLKPGYCLCMPALRGHDFSQIVLRLRVIGLDGDGAFKADLRFRVLVQRRQNAAKAILCVRVQRVYRDGAPKALGCFVKSSQARQYHSQIAEGFRVAGLDSKSFFDARGGLRRVTHMKMGQAQQVPCIEISGRLPKNRLIGSLGFRQTPGLV